MNLYFNNKNICIKEYKNIFNKFKGLMFVKKSINYGIRFNKCNAIHTFFMKQNIDIIITDINNKIIYIKDNLPKNRIILPIKNGYYTYELPLNTAKYFELNNIIDIR